MSYLGATVLIFPGGVSIGTNTAPYNTGGVASVIVEIGAEVDSLIAAAGYEVPVSPTIATDAYAVVQRAVRNGVYGVVLNTLFPNMGSPADKATSLASSYAAAYAQFRKDLQSGNLILVGAPSAGSEQGRVLTTGGGQATVRIGMDTRF